MDASRPYISSVLAYPSLVSLLNAADYSNLLGVCKEFANVIRKNYIFWEQQLDNFANLPGVNKKLLDIPKSGSRSDSWYKAYVYARYVYCKNEYLVENAIKHLECKLDPKYTTGLPGGETSKVLAVPVVGEYGAGKSAFTIQFVQQVFAEEYDRTIEDYYYRQFPILNRDVLYFVLDTAGDEELPVVRYEWFLGSNLYIIMFDITKRITFTCVNYHYENICRLKKVESVLYILVGGKSDLEAKREVSKEEAEEYARKNNTIYIEASAKNNINVDASFEEVFWMYARSVVDKEFLRKKQKKANKNKCSLM